VIDHAGAGPERAVIASLAGSAPSRLYRTKLRHGRRACTTIRLASSAANFAHSHVARASG